MSKHANVGLLKALKTHGLILIKLVKPLLIEFQLMDKVIAYVIDKGCDLNTIRTKLSLIGTCAPLKLEQPFVGFFLVMQCLKHANMQQMTQSFMWDEGSVIEKCKVFCKKPNVLGLRSPIR
jgi:hypothetical protein